MKTAGQAAYEAFWTDGLVPGEFRSWESLPIAKKKHWERIAAAARDWQPPPEKTMGEEVAQLLDRTSPEHWARTCQAAGEACATIGAEREREAMREIVRHAILLEQHEKMGLMQAIDARGDEMQAERDKLLDDLEEVEKRNEIDVAGSPMVPAEKYSQLQAERDKLREALEDARAYQEGAEDARNAAEEERDKAASQRDALAVERDKLRVLLRELPGRES